MTDWKTIKVPPEDFDQATDYKPEKATWGDVVVAGAERLNDHLDSDPPPVTSEPLFAADQEEPVETIVTRVAEQVESGDGEADIERIESSLATIEERTGRLERLLEGLQG